MAHLLRKDVAISKVSSWCRMPVALFNLNSLSPVCPVPDSSHNFEACRLRLMSADAAGAGLRCRLSRFAVLITRSTGNERAVGELRCLVGSVVAWKYPSNGE